MSLSASIKATVVDSRDRTAWNAFVESCEGATVYHQFAWRDVIRRTFDHRCYYLAAIDGSGTWQGALPLAHIHSLLFGNTLVSLPFVNYGGILAKTPEAQTALSKAAEELRRSLDARTVELRHIQRSIPALPTKAHKVTMLLDVASDVESQWRALNGKVRNQIRKAQSSELQTVIGQQELLDDFYRVFARNMRDLGSPVFPKRFFSHVLRSFPDTSRIIAVYKGAEVAAAGLILWHGDWAEVPWASSMRSLNSYCPNNLLYWEAIRFSIERGFKTFDFGRCTPNAGTYNFKKQWGAKPITLNWQYLMEDGQALPSQEDYGQTYRRAIKVWQHLPLGLSMMVGPSIRKRISL